VEGISTVPKIEPIARRVFKANLAFPTVQINECRKENSRTSRLLLSKNNRGRRNLLPLEYEELRKAANPESKKRTDISW
jgi:hypothetical protein